MNYTEWKAIQKEAQIDELVKGHFVDSIWNTITENKTKEVSFSEWPSNFVIAKKAYKESFAKLRIINGYGNSNFKTEIKRDRLPMIERIARIRELKAETQKRIDDL